MPLGTPIERWDRRRFSWGLLALAWGFFLLALVLPVDNGGRIRGWEAVGFLVARLLEDFRAGGGDFRTVVRLALLQVTWLFVVPVVALPAGFRTLARAAASGLAVVGWAVAVAIVWHDRSTFADFANLMTNGQGTLAWFAALSTLAAAAFVWPRPDRPAGE